jgi:plastocyanin
VSGSTVTYQVPALAAGTYGFICEVHPDMKGTITAQ